MNSQEHPLRFREDGTFRVLMMSDLQESSSYDPRSLRSVEALLDECTPDLVILGGDNCCQEQDCKQLCKRIGNSFALLKFMLLEAERSVAERGFQKRRAAQSRREMRRLSSCSDRRSISAIL